MAFHPIIHEPVETVRFGRVLLVEPSAPPSQGTPCRYCRVLLPDRRVPTRTHFSVPESAARVVLAEVERGISVDALVLGGPGEPLRHGGLGTILRKLRTASHLRTIVMTNGELLVDRDVRRELREGDTVAAWLPALRDAEVPGPRGERDDLWERHVEGIASLRRETQVRIVLELPVRPGRNDGVESREAWRRAAERIRPERIMVIPDSRSNPAEIAAPLDSVRRFVHSKAGAFLADGTAPDCRCYCER
jgi:wyosine [tRNA(Phe)-imidazoG37] synthetase (radical SAM superfamily)